MIDTKNINLLVFDTKENFEKSKRFLGEEGVIFQRILCVENAEDFEAKLSLFNDDELIFLVVHVFYTDNIAGIKRFVVSGIKKYYPNMDFMYISEGDSLQIKHQMVNAEIPTAEIYKYHQVESS